MWAVLAAIGALTAAVGAAAWLGHRRGASWGD